MVSCIRAEAVPRYATPTGFPAESLDRAVATRSVYTATCRDISVSSRSDSTSPEVTPYDAVTSAFDASPIAWLYRSRTASGSMAPAMNDDVAAASAIDNELNRFCAASASGSVWARRVSMRCCRAAITADVTRPAVSATATRTTARRDSRPGVDARNSRQGRRWTSGSTSRDSSRRCSSAGEVFTISAGYGAAVLVVHLLLLIPALSVRRSRSENTESIDERE